MAPAGAVDLESAALRCEAEAILRETDLLARLAPYGQAGLVGSVALDLVVKRDIDLHLLVAPGRLFPTVEALWRALLDLPRVREVRITDYRAQGALKLAVDAYPGPSGEWSIDIWVTERPAETAFQHTADVLARLAPEHRAAILALKRHYHALERLRDGLSTRIYWAVLEDGVRDVPAMERWLSEHA